MRMRAWLRGFRWAVLGSNQRPPACKAEPPLGAAEAPSLELAGRPFAGGGNAFDPPSRVANRLNCDANCDSSARTVAKTGHWRKLSATPLKAKGRVSRAF